MERLSLQLIHEAHESPRLNESVVRGLTQATHALCEWAADAAVPESAAAPCVRDAVRKLSGIVHRMRQTRAPAISKGTQQGMLEAFDTLRSFLTDDDEDDVGEEGEGLLGMGLSAGPYGLGCSAAGATTTSANSLLPPSERDAMARRSTTAMLSGRAQGKACSRVRARALVLYQSMSAEEVEATAFRVCAYLRGLTCGCLLIVVAFTLAMVLSSMRTFDEHVEEWEKAHTQDLLSIAVNALDALYPALAAESLNIRNAGLLMAAALLAELSTTHAIGEYSKDRMVFLSPGSRLYEFRAGVQDFSAAETHVTSVLTRRYYGELCRMNQSYPMESLNDAGWRIKSVVTPRLTPGFCENDAGPQGVFMNVQPPYKSYAPYVKTYRRTAARLANFHHAAFGITVAVTVDHAPLQNLLVPRFIFYGAQNIFSFSYDTLRGWWRGLLVSLIIVLAAAGAGLALITQLFTLPQLQFRGHRLVLALCLTLFSAAAMLASALFTAHFVQAAGEESLRHRTENVARCLASGFTSSTLRQYGNARLDFIRNAITESLAGRLFFFSNGSTLAIPNSMQPVADAIGAAAFAQYPQAITVGVAGGYSYADFAQPGEKRHIIVVDKVADYPVRLPQLPILGVAAVVSVFMLSLVVLYATPLRHLPLLFARNSPVLTYTVTPPWLRGLYYTFIAVLVLVGMVTTNSYGVVLLQEAMVAQAKDTLQIIASANRAPVLVDTCSVACGFPSSLIGIGFRRSANGTALTLTESMALPYYVVTGWTDRYMGAQLAISQMPLTLERSASFSTPLVNETSRTIHANRIVRNLMAAVDINETNGFVLERLDEPYGDAGKYYSFAAYTIGLTIAGVGLCVSFSCMGWLYTRLMLSDGRHLSLRRPGGVLRPTTKSGRVFYYALYFIASILLPAGLVLISASVMRGRMKSSMQLFSDYELTMAVVSEIERLESVGLADDGGLRRRRQPLEDKGVTPHTARSDSQADHSARSGESSGSGGVDEGGPARVGRGGPPPPGSDAARALAKQAAAVAYMEDSLNSGARPFACWRLLQEWPAYGSNRVRVLAGPADLRRDADPDYVPELHSFGRLDYGTVGVCGSTEGSRLALGVPDRVRYCYVEIPGGSVRDTFVRPRSFIMLARLEREVITEPAENAWRALALTSVGAAVVVLLVLGLVTWWFLAASHFHAYAVFADSELLTVQGPIPRFFQAIDMYIPRRFRCRWAVTTALGAMAVLIFFATSTSLAMSVLADSRERGLPSITFESILLNITNRALMHGYDYMLVAQPQSLAAIRERARAVGRGRATYTFLSNRFREATEGEIAGMEATLSALPDLSSVQASDLVQRGWGTYQTLMAHEYANFVEHQRLALSHCQSLIENMLMLFRSGHAFSLSYEILSDIGWRRLYMSLLHNITEMRDTLRLLFILDSVSIASYLVLVPMDGGVSVDNAYWPFETGPVGSPTQAGERVKKITATARQILILFQDVARRVEEGSEGIFHNAPPLLTVARESLYRLYHELPRAAALVAVVHRSDPTILVSRLAAGVVAAEGVVPPIWRYQYMRAREVNYARNFSARAATQTADATALRALATASADLVPPIAGEVTFRKSLQLVENLQRGVPLSTMSARLRWECFLAVESAERWARVAFVCTCVLYSVWVLASACRFALTRERVECWLRGVSGGPQLSAASPEKIPLVHASRATLPSRPTAGSVMDVGGGGGGSLVAEAFEEGEGGGAVRRSRVFCWTRPRALPRDDPSAEGRSGGGSGAPRDFWTRLLHRHRHGYVLRVFLLLGGLALVPVGLNYWLLRHAVTSARDPDGAQPMGTRTVFYQLELEESCTALFVNSARFYLTNELASLRYAAEALTDRASRLAFAYMWRTREPESAPRLDTGARSTSLSASGRVPAEVANLLELAEAVKGSVLVEALLFHYRVSATGRVDVSRGISAYARDIIDRLEPPLPEPPRGVANVTGQLQATTASYYDDLMPMSTAFGASALHAQAESIYARYLAAAEAVTTVQEMGAQAAQFTAALQALENITEAEREAWAVVVLAPRSDGGVPALTHGLRVGELVGGSALDGLDDGTATAALVVKEARDFFADVLPLLADTAAITTAFTTLDVSDMPGSGAAAQSLPGAVTAAAVTANYLSRMVTEESFRHVFAFNRGLAQLSNYSVLTDDELVEDLLHLAQSPTNSAGAFGAALAASALRRMQEVAEALTTGQDGSRARPGGRFGERAVVPLVERIAELDASSRELLQRGVTGVDHYAAGPARSNLWTWKREIFAVPTEGSVYTQIPYLRRCQSWCSTCAIWVVAIAMIYVTFAMELVS